MLIYLIVNRLNGKLYVGKTTLSLAARRWPIDSFGDLQGLGLPAIS